VFTLFVAFQKNPVIPDFETPILLFFGPRRSWKVFFFEVCQPNHESIRCSIADKHVMPPNAQTISTYQSIISLARAQAADLLIP
jgi:hypothetical protein